MFWRQFCIATFFVATGFTQSGLHQCLESAVDEVAFQGQLLFDVSDVHRYNLDIDTEPAAVTYPRDANQVAGVVKCAKEAGLRVQAKSGGHSYANHGYGGSSGAVVIDVKNFQQFSMDRTTWQAKIGSGTKLDDVTQRLHDAGGRAMSHGTCPQIGAGGHFTIGGFGPTSRQYGTSLDHVIGAEVVLANSSIIQTSETENPDVFFAIRGAASGFGIVTEFTVRTEEESGSAVQYSYSFTFSDAQSRAELYMKWQSFVTQPTLTRKLASTLTLLEHSIVISGTFFGTETEYAGLNLKDRFPGTNNASELVFTSSVGLLAHLANDLALQIFGNIPAHFYSKSRSLTKDSLLSDADAQKLFQYIDAADKGTPVWFAVFDFQGGATNDVAADATAYPHRDTLIWFQSYGISALGKVSAQTVRFLDEFNEVTLASGAVARAIPYAAYAGYVDPLLSEPQEAYWGLNLDRLRRIKKEVDPDNVFANPQSVRV